MARETDNGKGGSPFVRKTFLIPRASEFVSKDELGSSQNLFQNAR